MMDVLLHQALILKMRRKQTIGGYYQPSYELTDKAMRPSETLNAILAKLA